MSWYADMVISRFIHHVDEVESDAGATCGDAGDRGGVVDSPG